MSNSVDTGLHHSKLLRAIAERMAIRVLPQLHSPETVEDVKFAQLVLDYLASDLDLAPDLLKDLGQPYRQALQRVIDVHPDRNTAIGYARTLDAIDPQEGLSAQREIAALRDLAGRLIRDLSDMGALEREVKTAVQRLGELDLRWLQAYQAGVDARKTSSKDPGEQAGPVADLSAQSITQYLRNVFPQAPDLEVVEAVIVPGGKSKRTIALTLKNSAHLPAELIMRQDLVLKYAARSVVNEVKPLTQLGAAGLPVATPLYCEPGISELGGPFYLMDKLNGSPIGDFYGPSRSCPGTAAEIARQFAKLHSLPPTMVGFEDVDADPRVLVRNRIEEYWDIWRENTTRGSALVDYAFAWAREVIAKPYEGRPVIVHGDAGGFNWLVENDQLCAILDWEFMHLGDPAEDLGVIRPFVEVAMPWHEFMAIYRQAGGPQVPEERIVLADLMQWLKGTTLVAMSARAYLEGATDDYMKGVNSFAGLRKIEMKIATMLAGYLA
ncbi:MULTISPECIES: phosphotransferase family protein [Pseudomonas]|uniref:phosphotransferase family protein n=1 Tax=Pseudomonas TaxID=286 RepID=UPI0009BFF597|nr:MULTISPECIES: phosphotransferase family protein [Pseudomonas]